MFCSARTVQADRFKSVVRRWYVFTSFCSQSFCNNSIQLHTCSNTLRVHNITAYLDMRRSARLAAVAQNAAPPIPVPPAPSAPVAPPAPVAYPVSPRGPVVPAVPTPPGACSDFAHCQSNGHLAIHPARRICHGLPDPNKPLTCSGLTHRPNMIRTS
jgi:hypothetical protein